MQVEYGMISWLPGIAAYCQEISQAGRAELHCETKSVLRLSPTPLALTLTAAAPHRGLQIAMPAGRQKASLFQILRMESCWTCSVPENFDPTT
jgi:hypothetical protein